MIFKYYGKKLQLELISQIHIQKVVADLIMLNEPDKINIRVIRCITVFLTLTSWVTTYNTS